MAHLARGAQIEVLYEIYSCKEQGDHERSVARSGCYDPEANQVIEKYCQCQLRRSHVRKEPIAVVPMAKFRSTMGRAWLISDMSWLNL
jgi:hypothetical protein